MRTRTWARLAVLWRHLWQVEKDARLLACCTTCQATYQRAIARAERALALRIRVEAMRTEAKST